MDEALRQNIAQNYGGNSWKAVTGPRYPAADEVFQLFCFDGDVEHNGKMYRCVIIQKVVYDGKTLDIDYAEDVFSEAWEL